MIHWKKAKAGYKSECGRFFITRYIRRGGIEWGLTDKHAPFTMDAIRSRLKDVKDTAEWRFKLIPGE